MSDMSIKITQLGKSGSGYKVVGYTDYDLPKGLMVNDVVTNEDSLAQHIAKAFEKMDFGKTTTRNIVASIPESKAFVRVIQIPVMNEEQAVHAVPFEAEQYIPIPIEQTNLDWEILAKHEETMDVLVTASPKDYVESFLRVFKKAGLQPLSLEVESAACARSLIGPDKSSVATLILDMDTYRTSLIITENSHLLFTSSVPIAGDAFTQSIARALGIPANEAEKVKRQLGLNDSEEHQNVRAALSPVVDNLIAEVKNIIKFHDEHSKNPIKRIVLCGGSAKLKNIVSYMYAQMSDYSQIDILLGNPWVNLGENIAPNLNREDSLSFTTSIGLAIRGIQGL